ncbi:hypothetical protein [Streptomyces sp. R35]|uniref:Uncharacterized protein n=1 Tax=Streptomyces sp. R35 TaxID=3238630 RepID=A0AB39S5G1_9ACTN
MGAPPVVPRVLFQDFTGDDTYDAFVRAALLDGTASGGHHNASYVAPLTQRMARLLGQEAGTHVTVRVRRTEGLPVVIRTWPIHPQALHRRLVWGRVRLRPGCSLAPTSKPPT